MNTFDILKNLTDIYAVSGDESVALNFLEISFPNSKINTQNGGISISINNKQKSPKILIDAHIDSIGFRVTSITDDGFICFDKCGGVDARLMPCQKVLILGKKTIQGVVCSTPPHLSSGDSSEKIITDMYIDTGLSKIELENIVSVGDCICFDSPLKQLQSRRVSGASLDNRAGCCAVFKVLKLIEENDINASVTAVFSYQEEIGLRGARTAAFSDDYDYAICVDVSFAMAKGENAQKCGIMGKGAMIGISPFLDKKMSNSIIDTAKKCNIPYQLEVMSDATSTNADAYGVTKSGIKTSLLSIPIRYMHTPTEVCDLDDVDNTANLLFEYIKALSSNITER